MSKTDNKQAIKLLQNMKLLVLDFDGVMTDNRVLVSQDGTESVFCNRSDGWGIHLLKQAGVSIQVISTETNPVVAKRCEKLSLKCIHGSENKLAALKKVAQELSLEPKDIAYVGNDTNDLACLEWVGVPIAVADAYPEIIEIAKLVTSRKGGYGAVREVADWILQAQKSLKT